MGWMGNAACWAGLLSASRGVGNTYKRTMRLEIGWEEGTEIGG